MLLRTSILSMLTNFTLANEAGYFRYNGSFTTPSCQEGVLWSVYNKTIPISENQVNIQIIHIFSCSNYKSFLNSIFKMNAFYKNDLKSNFRGIQDLHDRKLYFSKPFKFQPNNRTNNTNSTVIDNYNLNNLFDFLSYIFKDSFGIDLRKWLMSLLNDLLKMFNLN